MTEDDGEAPMDLRRCKKAPLRVQDLTKAEGNTRQWSMEISLVSTQIKEGLLRKTWFNLLFVGKKGIRDLTGL